MKPLVYFLICTFLFACQQNKENNLRDGAESLQETIRKINEKNLKDSLSRAFCNCLIEDSLTNEVRLKKIDALLKRKVNINTPCEYSKSVTYKSAGNLLQNVGASLSNFLLRTHISKKSSQKTVRYSYPPVILFAQNTDMVQAFIERGADAHLKTKDAMSLGQIWAVEGLGKVELLDDWGVDMSKTQIGKVDAKTLAFLIDKGAKVENIDKTAFFESKDYKHFIEKYKIPLQDCSCEEFNKIVREKPFNHLNYQKAKIVLDAEVSIECVDVSLLENLIDKRFVHQGVGSRAKHAEETQKKWLELLQKYKVNWNQCGTFNKSILVKAISARQVNVVRFLLDNGATPNFKCVYKDKHNTTALEAAKGQVELWKDKNWKKGLDQSEKILKMVEEVSAK
jgi:hypothetical protein